MRLGGTIGQKASFTDQSPSLSYFNNFNTFVADATFVDEKITNISIETY